MEKFKERINNTPVKSKEEEEDGIMGEIPQKPSKSDVERCLNCSQSRNWENCQHCDYSFGTGLEKDTSKDGDHARPPHVENTERSKK